MILFPKLPIIERKDFERFGVGIDYGVEDADEQVIFGIRFIPSKFVDATSKQIRFPRSKKKRIRKKWAKNPENFVSTRGPDAFVMAHTMYVADKFYRDLEDAIMRGESEYRGPGIYGDISKILTLRNVKR